MRRRRFVLYLSLLLLPLAAGAQSPDSLAVREMVALLDTLDTPADFRTEPGEFKQGAGVSVDTLDIQDGRLLLVLRDDHTWYYIKNFEKLAQDSTFTKAWIPNSTNPYRIPLDSLPLHNTICLVDSASTFVCPNQTKVFSRFGTRRGRAHQGVDLPLRTGTPVYAAFDGRVRASTYSSGYGNLVIIRHENGLETYYGHLSKREVEVGDWVHAGDEIGLGGSTGRSTGPHLHFETRYMGFAFDPEWIADYETGQLRKNVFVLRRSYLSANSHYVPETIDEEDEIYASEEKIVEEEKRIAAERAAMRYYTVKSGDTLGAIAKREGKSLSTIQKLNPGVNPNKLRIGQKIRVN